MNVALIGAPGAPRSGVLSAMRDIALPGWDVRWDNSLTIAGKEYGLALDESADYRTELFLASYRAMDAWFWRERRAVFSHTLMDSAVHVAVKIAELSQWDNPPEFDATRWAMAAEMIGQIVRDSYRTDLLLYVPGAGRSNYAQSIDRALPSIFERFKLAVIPLNEGSVEEQAVQAWQMIQERA